MTTRTKKKDAKTDEIQQRQLDALDLRKKGYSLRAIGEQLDIGHVQVKRDIEAALAMAAEEVKQSAGHLLAIELERVDALLMEYWEAWEKSKQPVEKTISEKRQGVETETSKASIQRTGRTGDPRYLAGIQWCIERRAKFLGLDAPEKTDWTSGGQPIKFYMTVSPDDWDKTE